MEKKSLPSGGEDCVLRESLESLMTGPVLFGEPLKNHTSMGVGGAADALVYPRNREELASLLDFFRKQAIPFFILGNGTNVIFGDGGFRGVVVSLKNLAALHLLAAVGENRLIQAEAGAGLGELVELTCNNGLTGLEFCAGIPGSVGGALKMNAGAYGREIKDCVVSISIIDEEGVVKSLGRPELSFSYRNLRLPAGSVILAAEFILKHAMEGEIIAKVNQNLRHRRQRHPLNQRSAGSIFKNPPGESAGRIIDRLGLKGWRIGDAQVSPLHGNFIVNLGQAKALDVIDLIGQIKRRVQADTGVCLEEEVVITGEES